MVKILEALWVREFVVVMVILIIGGVFYFANLEKTPLGLDEISPGYNAYAIWKTGRDEYGKVWPISLRYNGTYSPPLYSYLTIPMVAILGLEPLAVRMVAALSALGVIVVGYLVLRSLGIVRRRWILFLGLLMMAISPWLVIYARSGYEATLPLVFYEIAVLFFWWGLKKPQFLMLGMIVLSLSVYSSYTNKLLAPLLVIGGMILFREIIFAKNYRKFLIIGVISAVVIQIPNISLIFTKSFFVKNEVSFGENILYQYAQSSFVFPGFVVLPYLYVREFCSQYLTYFSPRSLFWDGDPLGFRSIPGLSVFYSWMVVPYLVGLFMVWRNRRQIVYKYLILVMMVSPIPAAFTKDPFWTYRAIPLLLPLVMVMTIGLDRLLQLKIRLIKILLTILVVISIVFLWQGLFVLLPIERANDWQFGYQQLADEILSRPSEKFVIDNASSELAYLELAFWMKLPPEKLQQAADPQVRGDYYNYLVFNPNYAYSNVTMQSINWNDVYKPLIMVGGELTFSPDQVKEHELEKVFEIQNPAGKIVFVGYRTHPDKKCLKTYMATGVFLPVCQEFLK